MGTRMWRYPHWRNVCFICTRFRPSSIYSWSIGNILEHEFFCLGRLGSSGSKEKKVDLSYSEQLLRVFFSTFWEQNYNFFKNILATALKSYIKKFLFFYFFFLKKFKIVEKIGYYANFNFDCNTESGSKESQSISLGAIYLLLESGSDLIVFR